nr:ubiquitin-specific protease 13 [Tanacetum cinerariifolium]
MSKRDEMASRNRRSKVDSSSIQVADAGDGGLPKDKKNYKKYSKVNKVLHPKPSPNTKSSIRRLPKEVAKEKGHVKPKAAQVESNVGKRKRLVNDKEVEDECDYDVEGSDGESDFDKEHKVSEEADVSNESEEEGKGVKTKFFKGKEMVVVSKFKKRNEKVEDERDSDVEGSDGESDYDKEHKGSEEADLSNESEEEEVEDDVEGNESEEENESEEDKETEVSKESDDSKLGVKDVKMKGVKGNKMVVVSKAKKWKHVSDSSSEEEKVSKPKKVSNKKKQVKDVKKRKHVSDSSSSYDESSSSEEEKPLKNKKCSKHVKDVKKKKKPLTIKQIKKIKYLSDLPCLRFRTVPSSLFALIRDSQVDMESFLSDIRFSSFYNVFIDTIGVFG